MDIALKYCNTSAPSGGILARPSAGVGHHPDRELPGFSRPGPTLAPYPQPSSAGITSCYTIAHAPYEQQHCTVKASARQSRKTLPLHVLSIKVSNYSSPPRPANSITRQNEANSLACQQPGPCAMNMQPDEFLKGCSAVRSNPSTQSFVWCCAANQ